MLGTQNDPASADAESRGGPVDPTAASATAQELRSPKARKNSTRRLERSVQLTIAILALLFFVTERRAALALLIVIVGGLLLVGWLAHLLLHRLANEPKRR